MAQQRELYRKRASASGKDTVMSGKEAGAQPKFHVRGALRRSSITSQGVQMST